MGQMPTLSKTKKSLLMSSPYSNLIGRGKGIKITFKLPGGTEMRGYCLITELSLA